MLKSFVVAALGVLGHVTGASAGTQENTRSVFFLHDSGEVRAYPRKTGPAPLTDLLKAFFDGPKDAERAAGAHSFNYGCISFDNAARPAKVPCGFSDIIDRVRVLNGRALLEVKAFPNASASGIWETLDQPLAKIVKQFPNLHSWAFVMEGYEISGGDFGSPCGNQFCFLFSNSRPQDSDAMEALSNYGVKRLGNR